MLLSGIGKALEDATRRYNGYAVIVEKDTGALVANSMGENNFALLENGTLDRHSIGDLANKDIRQAYETHLQKNGSHSIFEGEEEKIFVAIREIKATEID